MGPDFAVHSTAVLQVLAFAVVINSVAAPSYQALQAMGRPGNPGRLSHFGGVPPHPAVLFSDRTLWSDGRCDRVGGASLSGYVAADGRLYAGGGISYRSFLSRALLRPAIAATALIAWRGLVATTGFQN